MVVYLAVDGRSELRCHLRRVGAAFLAQSGRLTLAQMASCYARPALGQVLWWAVWGVGMGRRRVRTGRVRREGETVRIAEAEGGVTERGREKPAMVAAAVEEAQRVARDSTLLFLRGSGGRRGR